MENSNKATDVMQPIVDILGIGMALETALNLSLHPALAKMVKEDEIDKMKG